MPEAIVIGGGIVGASAAYHLVREGVETLLLDREDDGRATPAGSGILSPPTSSMSGSDAWFRLAADALPYYPGLVEAVEDESGLDTDYDRSGLVFAAFSEAAVGVFEATLERARARSHRLGFPDSGSVYEIDPDEAVERFPVLDTPVRAFHYEDGARVDGGALASAMLRAGEAAGLEIRRESAREIVAEGDAVVGVITAGGERLDAERVVVAGGAWSADFGDDLGLDLPVVPTRGQVVHLGHGRGTGGWPVVMTAESGSLVPWPDGRIAVTSTKEPGVGFDPRATAEGVGWLLDRALGIAPGLRDATFEGPRVGLRPATPDELPAIGPVPGVEGAYVATGHGATGLQLGPYTGKLVADLVAGREPESDLSAFRVDRFE